MEIKFRGLKKDTNEFVYGSYHSCVGKGNITLIEWVEGNRTYVDKEVDFNVHWILTPRLPSDNGWDIQDSFQKHEVIPESVGQYIGKKDKNGIDIYSGDKVFVKNLPNYNDHTHQHMSGTGIVFYNTGELGFEVLLENGFKIILTWGGTESIEIIK